MPLRTKVSGFSIVKNGVRLGYPFKESLLSLAPLCDELVVALGDGDDTTGEVLEQLRSQLACPLVIIHSPWNKNNIQGGSELANQTNIALSHCKNELCFYIQCDEVLHEDDYELLRQDFIRLQNNTRAQALVLQWVHFYGNFHTYVHSRKWYRREIRVIKKSSGLKSFSDAPEILCVNRKCRAKWFIAEIVEGKIPEHLEIG
jgi:glycosyltransferase involved in cell wall biosynthesis